MKRIWLVSMVVVAALLLTGCAQTATPPALAAVEEPSLRLGGGGGVVLSSSGQIMEGLVVVGTGTVDAEPQVARVSLGVDLRGDDPAEIVEEGAGKIDGAIAAAAGLGIAQDDIRTTGYSLWVETVYNPETGAPTGEVIYHLSHYIEITVRDLDQVGNLLAQAVQAGVNSVSGVSFGVDDPQAMVEQARRLALIDAQARASAMAQTLGITLGRPLLVTETGYSMPYADGIGGGGMGMSAAPTVSPGAFSVSVSVQVVYELP